MVRLAARVPTDEGIKHITESIKVYRAAFEAGAREGLPLLWIDMERNLARAYFIVGDWENSARAFDTVFQVDPDDEVYGRLTWLYQHRLFNFERAFALTKEWFEKDPNDVVLETAFVEKFFTTARFSECLQRIKGLLAKSRVPPNLRVAMQATEISSLLAQGTKNQVPAKLDVLIADIARQPETFIVEWNFDGSRYFVDHNDKLARYRVWLGHLLDALEGNDRDTALKSLRNVRAETKAIR